MKNRRGRFSWALYDWGNSAYATTIMAVFIPQFFRSYWGSGFESTEITFYLGAANSFASLIIMLIAPVLGAVADQASVKKRFLLFFAFLGIVMTAAMAFIAEGQLFFGIFIYVVSLIGFSGGNIFYDALLILVSDTNDFDMTSSLGFAFGYLGGGILLAVNLWMFSAPKTFGFADGTEAVKAAFVSVALWWAVFSIPLLLFVKEEKKNTPSLKNIIGESLRQLLLTARQAKKNRAVFIFLTAYWFYMDGVDTVVRMAVEYGGALGFPQESLIIAILMVQFIAFPAAIGYSFFAKKVGIGRALLIAITAYCLITIFAFFMQKTWHFYILAAVVGLFMGGIQALSRSFYARLIPVEHAGQFFGLFNMMGKFAAVIGPVLMGYITVVSGSQRVGILSILVLLLFGAFFLVIALKIEKNKKIV